MRTPEKTSIVRRVRTMNAADAPKAAAWISRARPVPEQLVRSLPNLLQRLIVEETLSGVIVEYGSDHNVEPELAAFGLSGFVSEACVQDYLASPTPHFEIVLLDRASRNEPAFLAYEDIAKANAGEGLTLVPLIWLQRSYDLADPEAHMLLALGQQTLLAKHRGYRLTRVLKEIPAHLASAFMGGGFKEHRRITAGAPLDFLSGATLAEDHIVFTITKADMEGEWPGKIIGHLFMHQPPRCAFTRAEQKVLLRALDGLTDEKIAQELAVSPDAIAKRWETIYRRVAERAPSVLQLEEGVRGPEKRRPVIAFVSEHPEELRPYAAAGRRNGKPIE